MTSMSMPQIVLQLPVLHMPSAKYSSLVCSQNLVVQFFVFLISVVFLQVHFLVFLFILCCFLNIFTFPLVSVLFTLLLFVFMLLFYIVIISVYLTITRQFRIQVFTVHMQKLYIQLSQYLQCKKEFINFLLFLCVLSLIIYSHLSFQLLIIYFANVPIFIPKSFDINFCDGKRLSLSQRSCKYMHKQLLI